MKKETANYLDTFFIANIGVIAILFSIILFGIPTRNEVMVNLIFFASYSIGYFFGKKALRAQLYKKEKFKLKRRKK